MKGATYEDLVEIILQRDFELGRLRSKYEVLRTQHSVLCGLVRDASRNLADAEQNDAIVRHEHGID